MSGETLLFIIFQIILTVILLRISGEIGKLSISRGYSSMVHAYRDNNLSFNLFYRILYLPVALGVIATILYLLKLDTLVMNIWMVSIWYFVLQLLLSLKKLPYTNLKLYLGSALFSIILTRIFYVYGISKGLTGLLPDPANFRTELWFIVFLFFYGLLNNYRLDSDHGGYRKKLERKYLQLKNKYGDLLTEKFKQIKILNDLFFSIMIFEDVNRPKWFRFLETILFRFGLAKTIGIMQVQNPYPANDLGSINKAQALILESYEKYNRLEEYKLIEEIITEYNPDAYYRGEVKHIYSYIQDISQFLEGRRFEQRSLSSPDIYSITTDQMLIQIAELESQLSTLVAKENDQNQKRQPYNLSKNMITYDEFKKVEIRVGKILVAEKVAETDKLLKLIVDVGLPAQAGEKDETGAVKPRQIVSGIAPHFPDPATLVGTTAMFVTNLEPRTIRGLESQGMLLAVSGPDGAFSLLKPNESIPPGSLAL